MDKTDGLAPPVLVPPPLVEVGIVTLPTCRDPSITAHARHLARGPPLA
jgi:hypothetical protein